MSSNTFDDVAQMIQEAIDLSDQVPAKYKNQVFEMLMKAIEKDGFDRNYKQEIIKNSKYYMPIDRFIDKYKPSSNIERSLCFTYYCQKTSINPITINHIQSCYELCNLSLPSNLQQNLRDACSKRYKYLYTTDTNCYKVDTEGEKFIKLIEEDF